MAKRKADEPDSDIDVSSTDDSDNEVEVPEETVDVDFDFFDLNADVDFHATKTFLRQLFGDDSSLFDVSALADLILAKNAVGTTIKTDGKESDPFAMLLVVNLSENIGKGCVKQVVDYVVQKTAPNTEFLLILKKLLAKDAKLKTGLIFSERLINMPVEVVPPMYRMLVEEMELADEHYDYFLVVSKIYKLVAANIEDDEKKAKKKKVVDHVDEFDYFHHEDEVLESHALYHGRYDYTHNKQETDSRRVFTEYGIDPKLSVILVDRAGLEKAVPEMVEKFPPF